MTDKTNDFASADASPYSVGEVAAAVNIPRATLLYYEQRGIVSPAKDDDNGYRRYTNQDVLRLMDITLLKNVGISPKDVGPYLEGDPFSVSRCGEYIDLLDHRIEYLKAQQTCLNQARLMQASIGRMGVSYIEPYYINYDTSEQGYRHIPSDPALDLLLKNLPISSIGACFTGDFFDPSLRPRWGRTVAVRYAHLVEGLSAEIAELDTIGDCECLVYVKFEQDVFIPRSPTNTVAQDMRAYLDEHALQVSGYAFVPFSLFSSVGTTMPVCIPVKRKH